MDFEAISVVTRQAKRVHHIVIFGLSASSIFLHISRHHFREEKIMEHKMCVLIHGTRFVWNIFHSTKN